MIVWTNFAQNKYFPSKTEKGNITIEFCIFESTFAKGYHTPIITLMAFFGLRDTITVLMSLVSNDPKVAETTSSSELINFFSP